jgi:hypothetical protein
MKRLFFAIILIAGSIVYTGANAQPYFRGRVGFGFPHPRGFYVPVRPIIAYPPVPAPYFVGGGIVAPPVYGYGYGYRHYAPIYRGRGFYRGRR